MQAVTQPYAVGVDFLTATLKQEEGYYFYEVVKSIKKLDMFQECEERHWRFYGYSGFLLSAGRDGHLAYGDHNYNGYIIQLSGVFSLKYWLQFVNVATNVSRIDIKVDCRLDKANEELALEYYNYILEHNHRGRKYSIVMTKQGGQTLYVGARASDQFGRLYDKSAEERSDVLGKIWRYEVEFKKQKAKAIADELAKRANIQPIEMFSQDIVATVYDWFDERVVPPVFRRNGQAILGVKAEIDAKMGKMLWLRKQVSPSVRSLLNRGCGQDVIEALGLDAFYDFVPRQVVGSDR